MSKYQLVNDSVQDTFEIELRDKKYIMRYPRIEEVEKIQDLSSQIDDAQKSEDKVAAKKLGGELEDYLYSFITPVDHQTPIKDALRSENIKVMKNFNVMIRQELSIQ